MQDSKRLGSYVVARRVALGYKQRSDFASAAQLSYRVVSDIETGRRTSFDAGTIARLEDALGWEMGSTARITSGGEPTVRGGAVSLSDEGTQTAGSPADEITMIYESSMSARQKLEAIRMVLALRKQAEAESGVPSNPINNNA